MSHRQNDLFCFSLRVNTVLTDFYYLFYRDLSSLENLKSVILWSLCPLSEEVRSAASYALGSVAVGCLNQYVPFILQEIETQPKRQYLLLHSLKEVTIIITIILSQKRTRDVLGFNVR